MTLNEKTRETLEKQLQLLSERSQVSISDSDLSKLTEAMVEISRALEP